MENYKFTIITAFAIFPLIAFLITLPFLIYNYHKYGSISKIRTLIIYSFILYLLIAYLLVILPLPSYEYVKALQTPRVQLVPFHFIVDFIKESGFHIKSANTYLSALTSPSFYQPLFNILLTIPFGVCLRYYFQYSLKKTMLFSFLLSLFFELTQLTGLYFVYPRSYRLFDVDDLLFNTLGGGVGYLLAGCFSFLPSRQQMDEKSIQNSERVSSLRIIIANIIDLTLNNIVFQLLLVGFILMNQKIERETTLFFFLITHFIGYVVVPLFLRTTLGKHFLNLRIEGKRYRIIFRYLLFYSYIYLIPIGIAAFYKKGFVLGLIGTLLYLISLCRSLLKRIRKQLLWYERLTNTKNKNTLIISDQIESIE